MQGTENEVTSFGGSDCRACSLEVSHLTDHNDVRVLPEDVFQTGCEFGAVRTDF
ncbi:unnamed protein product, partial [marine sediment metagenome]